MALLGKVERLVDVGDGRHADGAAGARDELDRLGQQAADAEPEDLVRVRAADFHDADLRAPIAGDDGAVPYGSCVHSGTSSSSLSSVIFAMATPAWTMT